MTNFDLIFISVILLILVIIFSVFILCCNSRCDNRNQIGCLYRIQRLLRCQRRNDIHTININGLEESVILPYSKKIVKHIEKTNNDPDLECPICFEKIGSTSCFIGCDHAFHEDCIKKWIIDEQKTTCPICRSEVATNTVTCF